MPLNATVLASLIKGEIVGEFDDQIEEQLNKFCEGIASAVITHITTAGVVNVTGIATCSTGGGPVTASGTMV